MGRLARLVFGPAFIGAIAVLALLPELTTTGTPWFLVPFKTTVLLSALALGLGLAVVIYAVWLAREDRSALQHAGAAIEAIVPVYRDAEVLHRSVEALCASDYEPLEITVVVEPDDAESQCIAQEMADQHESVSVLVNEARAGSKAGALNTAVEAGDAPLVALFDADQRPHPNLLPHAVTALEDADIARVRSLPDPAGGGIESMIYYEYLFLYFLPQKLVKLALGLAFAGTRSVLVERTVLEEVGGFSEGHLAEDLDFTHRVHRAGIEIRELLYYPSFEAPAHNWQDWWGQRRRWMHGQVEVSASVLTQPRRLLTRSGLDSTATLAGTLIAGVLLSLTLPKLLLAALDRPLAVGAALASVYAVALATRALDDRSAGLSGFGLGWLLLPLAFSLYGLVIVRVLLGFSLGREEGWYSTDKERASQ